MTINDLIATSSHHAFETGKRSERELIMRTMKEVAWSDDRGEFAYIADLEEYLNDKDNK
ncbi:hypothetical protein N9262_02220 [Akkermansiaceae bacterium]|nr:hypothetical protein [Akkermansiaceae bacterium]